MRFYLDTSNYVGGLIMDWNGLVPVKWGDLKIDPDLAYRDYIEMFNWGK